MLGRFQTNRFADFTLRKDTYKSQVKMLPNPVSPGHVNSDHLLGHGDAAVKLQRDWLLDPQALPFAPHIKTHALVSLIQKGLQYYQIEQSLDQVSHNAPS